MAVVTPVATKGSVEVLGEDRLGAGTWGSLLASGAMKAIGLVSPFEPHYARILKENTYLPAYADVNDLMKSRNLQVGGELTGKFSYYPQDWDLLEYATGDAAGLDATVDSLSILSFVDSKYTLTLGSMVTDYTIKIPVQDWVQIDVSYKAGDVADPSGVDPATTHAAEASGNPFLWSGVSNLKFDANDPPTTEFTDVVGEIILSIKNDWDLPVHGDSTMWTHAAGPILKSRKIEASLGMIWGNVDSFWDIMKASTKQNLRFTIGAKTFDVKGLIVPELNLTQNPEDYIGETINFVSDRVDLVMS
jgi:hypothetical protein